MLYATSYDWSLEMIWIHTRMGPNVTKVLARGSMANGLVTHVAC